MCVAGDGSGDAVVECVEALRLRCARCRSVVVKLRCRGSKGRRTGCEVSVLEATVDEVMRVGGGRPGVTVTKAGPTDGGVEGLRGNHRHQAPVGCSVQQWGSL